MNKSELIGILRKRAAETPLFVEETDTGFRLTLNIVDAKWYTMLQKNGITSTFLIDGIVNEKTRTVATTDTSKTIKWRAEGAAPTLGGSVGLTKGELYGKGFGKQYGVSESGKVGKAVDYAYDFSKVKRWLDDGLEEAGYRRVLGTTAKVGIGFAVFGFILAIVTVIALLFAL